jgi:hypothetical protein
LKIGNAKSAGFSGIFGAFLPLAGAFEVCFILVYPRTA